MKLTVSVWVPITYQVELSKRSKTLFGVPTQEALSNGWFVKRWVPIAQNDAEVSEAIEEAIEEGWSNTQATQTALQQEQGA